MDIPLLELIKLGIRQLYLFKKTSAILFLIGLVAVLVVGLVYPKKYTSSATLKLEDEGVIRPLMESRAAIAGPADWVKNATETVFVYSVLEGIVKEVDWGGMNLESDDVMENLVMKIRANTVISNAGQSFLKFSYTDNDRKRAFEVTQSLADSFIMQMLKEKRRNSNEAFDFISTQVETYKKNLTVSEEKLKAFKQDNVEGSISTTVQRINDIEQQLETANIELAENNFRLESLKKQLVGERAVREVSSEALALKTRINNLTRELDQMKLVYHDQYPDVIALKERIDELQIKLNKMDPGAINAMNAESEQQGAQGKALYSEIRSQISAIESNTAAINIRKSKLETILAEQKEKSEKQHEVEAELAELTRDYTVNRNIYQDLLMRRENARVSMNIELENKGASFRVVQPAKIPLQAQTPPFILFFLAAPLVALILPVVFAFAFVLVDQKIRVPQAIGAFVDVDVFHSIPHLNSVEDSIAFKKDMMVIILFFMISLSVYAAVGFLKYRGYL